MVMQSIDLADRLSFQNTADAKLNLSCDDASLGVGDDGMIVRAAQLLQDRSGFSELEASIHLEKRIPIGAGLAGGSSDGAAALVGLNALGAWATTRIWSGWPLSSAQTCPFVWPVDVSCVWRGEQLEACRRPMTPSGVVGQRPHGERLNALGYKRYRELNASQYLVDELLLNNAGGLCVALQLSLCAATSSSVAQRSAKGGGTRQPRCVWLSTC